MKNKRKRFFFIPLFIVAAVLVLSAAVMLLWNAILPDLLQVRAITYGQAIGLLILCRMLFGSFRLGPPGGFRRGGAPWKSKLMDLTSEERDNFKKEWEKRGADKNEPE